MKHFLKIGIRKLYDIVLLFSFFSILILKCTVLIHEVICVEAEQCKSFFYHFSVLIYTILNGLSSPFVCWNCSDKLSIIGQHAALWCLIGHNDVENKTHFIIYSEI